MQVFQALQGVCSIRGGVLLYEDPPFVMCMSKKLHTNICICSKLPSRFCDTPYPLTYRIGFSSKTSLISLAALVSLFFLSLYDVNDQISTHRYDIKPKNAILAEDKYLPM